MSSSSSSTDPSRLVEIDAGHLVYAVAFTANRKYLVNGGREGVRVWQVEDGKQVAGMQVKRTVGCVSLSRDGRWIAAGSSDGEVVVWDATTYAQVFAYKKGRWPIFDLDFSPDSTRLVSANGGRNTATVWDLVAHRKVRKVRTLRHSGWSVRAAKYSPQGDRIATVNHAPGSIRVWDGNNGRLLVDIKVAVDHLLWCNSHLFVKTEDCTIEQIDPTTGSTASKWSVPDADGASYIAAPYHGKFIAYSTRDNITFWSTSKHTQLGFIQQNRNNYIAFCPDGQLLAIGGGDKKIIIKCLSFITEPEIQIDSAVLDSWKHDQLTNAEELLSEAITTSRNTAHVSASRALVRARLRQWDKALSDAEESIKIRPSLIGYVAKLVALFGKGDTHAGYQACDIASQCFHSDYVPILSLIKAIVVFMAGEQDIAMSRIDHLISTVVFNSALYAVQAYMFLVVGNLRMNNGEYEGAIQSFELAQDKLSGHMDQPPLIVSLVSGWKFDDLPFTIQQHRCEALLAAGRTMEAGEFLLRVVDQEMNMTEATKTWVSDLMQKCLSTGENNGSPHWVTALYNNLSHPMLPFLREWARLVLMTASWRDALAASAGFVLPRSTIYQVICECLETEGYVVDAVACFHQVCSERVLEEGERLDWSHDFKYRCCGKLEDLGDSCRNARQYDEAISRYTAALALEPATPQGLLNKRSKAYREKGSWEDALRDANQVVELDPSSPWGYESTHAALHGMGRYDEATGAFEAMLSKMFKSCDPEARKRSHSYIRPEQTREIIRATIKNTIRDSPVVLINVTSGCLCDKTEQAAVFESMPVFTELVSSMPTRIDHALIERAVVKFYRYATFSHTWQNSEPLFDKVTQILVHDLEASPTHHKLQMFCKIAREAGLNWAWSDTCCINKGDHFVLQEALVSMFKWYAGSAMTIIFLLGVHRLAELGSMMKSIWNTRGWTLQEYHASTVVRFYTEDWTPYLGLDMYNHKDSPQIIREMEEATGISGRALAALRPGLGNIRDKLRLASTRQTTRVEDAAYSLLGIFSVSLAVTYGEGDKALGRLLSQLLTSSGDTSILAWTGTPSSFNSCLPINITVFSKLPTTHIPPVITDLEMDTITTGLCASLDLTLATKLYEQLRKLPMPFFVGQGQRMKLPCLTFKIRLVSASRDGSDHIFRAKSAELGVIDIKTKRNISRLDSLHLIHPWIDFLLDRRPVGDMAETILEDESFASAELSSSPSLPDTTPTTPQTKMEWLVSFLGRPFGGRPAPVRVLQFIARLKQPFGALLLTPTRRNVEEYRRIAADSVIRVQIQDITPAILDTLMQSVQTLDVL